MIVSFTGHRIVPESASAAIDQLLTKRSPSAAIVGGARGADTIAAERCYVWDIPYTVALPHEAYAATYGLTNDARFVAVLERAERVLYVTEGKTWHFTHNFKRNEWMVDNSDLLVAVSEFDPAGTLPEKGGTAHCIRHARRVGRDIAWARYDEEIMQQIPQTSPSLADVIV